MHSLSGLGPLHCCKPETVCSSIILLRRNILVLGRYYEVLGSGAFGTVHRGIWQNVESGSSEKEVAVKTVETKASEKDRIKFLQEAAIMGQFNHPNIIRLLGVVTIEEKPVRIMVS